MPTPTYQGPNQPLPDNGGWLSLFGGIFGTPTPAYVGEGQPSGGSSGFLGSSTPAYASGSSPSPTSASSLSPSDTPFGVCPGQIAIVIPRTEP